ncbi:GNAT family protein [Chamaesiphon sp. VAR_48_metabat_403]|uniref:GNAT family N-acetyltransferase n=1 Tax=Chamaesiphon sp. VAR_48_metabat_403 TaxID=2964700 RepID=UPI00286D912A|nr:GNAT family protein [Chamaesiphon sp. VAR_48_metabat_403]
MHYRSRIFVILAQSDREIGLNMEPVIPQDFTIETARCLLRCPTADDLPQIFSATRVAGFNRGMHWEPPATIEELEEPLKEQLLDWEIGKAFSFTIADPVSDYLIGRIGIRKTNRVDVWNLGFWTHPDRQGCGYMTESLAAVIAFGFHRLRANRIEASYALWNKASQRVLQKNGMKFIQYIPHAFRKRGHWIEANKVEITDREWLALSGKS